MEDSLLASCFSIAWPQHPNTLWLQPLHQLRVGQPFTELVPFSGALGACMGSSCQHTDLTLSAQILKRSPMLSAPDVSGSQRLFHIYAKERCVLMYSGWPQVPECKHMPHAWGASATAGPLIKCS